MLKREIIIAGNWKMNTTPSEGVGLAQRIASAVETVDPGVRIVVCPPATHLVATGEFIASRYQSGIRIELGGQNVHWAEKGAFTGEISAPMLERSGCRWVIIGHSERRQYFGETDETVNQRLLYTLTTTLRPIVCIGETLPERKAHITFDVLRRQLQVGLKGARVDGEGGLVIAYEPVWAIGTGETATPEQAEQAHRFIRDTVAEMAGYPAANATSILYGGSVTDKNAAELLACPDVDGALVGGASLDPVKFTKIVMAGSEKAKKG